MRDDLNRGDWHCFYLPDYQVSEKNYIDQKEIRRDQYEKISTPKHLSGYTGAHNDIPISASVRWFQNQLLHVLFEIG